MSTLKFLNKPPTKPIGPQPKPKSAFLDPVNPWAVPSTRSGTGSTPPARPAPPKTPAPTPQRAAIPSRGYNYTESDTASGKPAYVRRQEIDNAQMAAQATRQRRARPTPAAAPVKPALTVSARPLQNQLANAGDDYGAQRMAVRNAAPPRPQPQPETPVTPAPPDAWDVAHGAWREMYRYPNPLAPLAFQMDALTLFMDGFGEAWSAPTPPANNLATRATPQQPTPQAATTYQPAPAQPAYRPASATSTVTNAAPWQMAPTAEQAMAARPLQPTPTRAAPTPTQQPAQPSQMALTAEQAIPVRSMQPAPANAATPGIDVPAPLPPTTTPATPATTQATASGPFYGYAPPGPLTAARTVQTQRGQLTPYMTDRPQYTGWGVRALLSDGALAAEDAKRQRDAAGSFSALQASGRYRPWSSYSPAEKYYLRYGVMPEGEQLPPDYSGIEAMAQSRAQTERLKGEYVDRYGRYPRWDGYRVYDPAATQVAAWQASPERAKYLEAQGTAQAAPVMATTPTGPAQAAQIARNNQMLLQVNPQAATTGVRAQDANTVAREIAKRYMPDKDVSTLTLADIGAMLAMSYTPPPGLAQQYGYDMEWLAQYVQTK